MLFASGFMSIIEANEDTIKIKVGDNFRNKFLPLVKKREDLEFDMTIEMKCTIANTEVGGIMLLLRQSDLEVMLKEWRPPRTKAQNDTLRGVERFIASAYLGEKPSEDDVDEIHEAIIEAVMPEISNKFNGSKYHKRTSDATVLELARCIEYGLNWLATLDIPDIIVTSMGHGMKKLWQSWYEWRYTQESDPLLEDETEMKWDDYCDVHPVCELCGILGTEGDPLERMHIVSSGSNISSYEYPWNWIRAHNSHHVPVQHQHGWDSITDEFPHIAGKLKRARIMAEGTRRDSGETSGFRSWAETNKEEV